jgi:hypothetical protein
MARSRCERGKRRTQLRPWRRRFGPGLDIRAAKARLVPCHLKSLTPVPGATLLTRANYRRNLPLP